MTEPAPPPKGTLFIVFLVVFIDLLGFGIVLPIMPRLAERFLAGYSEASRGAMIGVLFSSFSLMQFLFAPMWGRVSDRIGRRPILLLGLAGSVVFYALFGLAASLSTEDATLAVGLMLLARVGAGIAGASVSTAAAVIADCTTPANRAKGMALIGIAFGGGFALGPMIAYFGLGLFDDKPWAVGAIASVLSAIALGMAIFLLKETYRPGAVPAERKFFSFGRTLDVLKMPSVGPLVLIYFLAIFAFANFEATLALFTQAAFKIPDDDNYRIFAYVGCVLLVAGGAYRPIVKKRPETLLLGLGVGLLFLGMAFLGLVAFITSALQYVRGIEESTKVVFYFAMTVSVVGFAFINPSVSALISKRADPHRQGEVLGVNQGCASLARILGPFVGSVAFVKDASHILPYGIACATLLIVLMLLPRIRPESSQPEAQAEG
jgi:MFS family permease